MLLGGPRISIGIFLIPILLRQALPQPLWWRQPSSERLQVELAHDLSLEIGYDGARGTKLAEERAFNQAVDATKNPIRGQTDNTLANLGLRLPFQGYSPGAIELQTEGSSWYNALEVSLNKRFGHGLQLLAAYTWARSLTDAN